MKTIQRRERSSAERERYEGILEPEAEREKRSQNSERELREREAEVFGEMEAERRSSGRIEHKSLILAQDERWRRA